RIFLRLRPPISTLFESGWAVRDFELPPEAQNKVFIFGAAIMIRGLGFHARRIEQKIFVTVAIVLATATAAHAGNVDSHWLLPSDGYWTDPTQWSTNPDYPNNGSPTGTTYD